MPAFSASLKCVLTFRLKLEFIWSKSERFLRPVNHFFIHVFMVSMYTNTVNLTTYAEIKVSISLLKAQAPNNISCVPAQVLMHNKCFFHCFVVHLQQLVDFLTHKNVCSLEHVSQSKAYTSQISKYVFIVTAIYCNQ